MSVVESAAIVVLPTKTLLNAFWFTYELWLWLLAAAPIFAGVTVAHVLSFLKNTALLAAWVVGTWLPCDAAA